MWRTRRKMLQAMSGSLALPVVAAQPACTNTAAYDAAAASTWRHTGAQELNDAAKLQELVRYATLAANSHNTQPWRFALAPDTITLRPDPSRRTPAVDPDDHHLWVSLGCAAENLLLAARAFGLQGDLRVENAAVRIALTPAQAQRDALFEAIPKRQCTRSAYDGKPLAADQLNALKAACVLPNVNTVWLTETARMQELAGFVTRGVQAQMADPAFVAELKQWLRFNPNDAAAKRDGLYSGASGNPSLPDWLGRRLFSLFFTTSAEVKRYQEHLRSSSGAVVFVAAKPEPAHWVEVGRAYQRFALQAAALNIRNAFVNQPVEVPAIRGEFAAWLGVGAARPDLVVRFGRAEPLPSSLRRPVAEVLDKV
jgi:hypothetical protein